MPRRMSWRITTVLGLITALLAVAGVARVASLESHEVRVVERVTLADLAEAEGATAESVRLTRVRLARDQQVVFELCADDAMPPERWMGAMAVAVWRPRARELMTRSELTAEVLAQVRRGRGQGCLTIGRGVIAEDDVYAVEALFDERPRGIEEVPLTVSVQAHRPLRGLDLLLLLSTWLCAIALVGTLPRRSARGPELDAWEVEEAARARPLPPEVRVGAGLALLVAALLGSGYLPGGAALALATGVALAALEVAIALGLAPGPGFGQRVSLLALTRPSPVQLWLPLAVVAGALLWLFAVVATRLVPSTGQSAVSVFVSSPSGLLSFACLAVLVPLAEEVFFRGFVYGVLEARSKVLAFLSAWLLFVLAHAPQTWGQWGALVAILVTGFALTSLRLASRSTWVPALAHLVYNGILAIGAVL